jgi:hypothetical protein
MSVASFHAQFRDLLRDVGATPEFDGRPNEMPDPVPFVEDRAERPYAADAVARFFHALIAVDRVFKLFRTGYLGKVSPVQLFWGSFDLAVTRFPGPRAPLHPGGIPALSDEITRRPTAMKYLPLALAGRRRIEFLRSILRLRCAPGL